MNKVMCEECKVNVMSMQLTVSNKKGRYILKKWKHFEGLSRAGTIHYDNY